MTLRLERVSFFIYQLAQELIDDGISIRAEPKYAEKTGELDMCRGPQAAYHCPRRHTNSSADVRSPGHGLMFVYVCVPLRIVFEIFRGHWAVCILRLSTVKNFSVEVRWDRKKQDVCWHGDVLHGWGTGNWYKILVENFMNRDRLEHPIVREY